MSKYSEEIYYLEEKILDYERKGIGSEKEYQKNLDKLEMLKDKEFYEQ